MAYFEKNGTTQESRFRSVRVIVAVKELGEIFGCHVDAAILQLPNDTTMNNNWLARIEER